MVDGEDSKCARCGVPRPKPPQIDEILVLGERAEVTG